MFMIFLFSEIFAILNYLIFILFETNYFIGGKNFALIVNHDTITLTQTTSNSFNSKTTPTLDNKNTATLGDIASEAFQIPTNAKK